MHGIESTARRMLDKGAPLSCGQDQDQESSPDLDPLGIAARSGNDSVVRLLLERRANPNADYGYPYTCSTPKTPLSQAIKGGNESTARILLDHGAESDFSQHPNDLASELAYEGDIDGIKFLGKMQCGFEFIDKFGDGDRPLVQAINGGHVDVVQYLLEIAGVNPNNLARKPVICYAAYQKNPMVVVCLLKNGADMDHSILDDSPLELAMRKRHMRVVSVLLKYMDMGKLHSSEQYMLPCAAAAACGSESRVHDLIDRGCHLDENEFDGGASFRIKCSSRALAWAAEMGHEKIVLQLLSNGADPHTQADNSCRQTKPLIAAIDGDHLHIAKLLLDEGVDPNTFDKNNYDRPLSAAVRRSRVDIVELLLESGAEPNVKGRPWPYEEALLTAVNEGHEKISMLFLDKGADPNTHNRFFFFFF